MGGNGRLGHHQFNGPFDHPKEACGVVGVHVPGGEASRLVFFGLFALQHRGQESAGIAAANGEDLSIHCDMGLVTQIFREPDFYPLAGELAIVVLFGIVFSFRTGAVTGRQRHLAPVRQSSRRASMVEPT